MEKPQMLQYMPDLLVLRNENAHLVDYLAYLDGPEKSDEFQEQANALVAQQMKEMARQGVKDYLKDFPLPQTTKIDSISIRSEIARVTQAQQQPSIADQYISVDAPSDPSKLQEAINRAKINFTAAEQRRLNLELDKQYGPAVWKEHLKQVASMHETIGVQNQRVQEEITEINRKRKFSQLSQADQLASLEDKYWQQLGKNKELECEIARIELQLQEARKVPKVREGTVDDQ